MNIQHMPNEIIYYICEYAKPISAYKLLTSCKRLSTITYDQNRLYILYIEKIKDRYEHIKQTCNLRLNLSKLQILAYLTNQYSFLNEYVINLIGLFDEFYNDFSNNERHEDLILHYIIYFVLPRIKYTLENYEQIKNIIKNTSMKQNIKYYARMITSSHMTIDNKLTDLYIHNYDVIKHIDELNYPFPLFLSQ